MYAKGIDKDYLMNRIGVTDITPDGKHIYINNKEVKQFKINTGHFIFQAYDSTLFKQIYPLTKSVTAGQVEIPVHRAVYAWYHGSIQDGLVVDHINNDKQDNRLENLQLLTPKQNIWKDRECDVREIRCRLNKPRSFYEDKLNRYIAEYENAKLMKDADLAHKMRAYISNTRARLRYWDSHR